MQQAQMTSFSGRMRFGVLLQRSACSGCSAAAGSRASIGSLCSQVKLVRTCCLWPTLCIFQHVLAFVKRETCGRKDHVCACGGKKNRWHPQQSRILSLIIPTRHSKIVKLVRCYSHCFIVLWIQTCLPCGLHGSICNLGGKQCRVSSQDAKLMRGFVSIAARR